VDLAVRAGVKGLCLWHHNHDRYDIGVELIEGESRRLAAERETELECFAARQDMEIVL
jgi:hypothetical protein